MSSKRPSPKTSANPDEWKITDEWGIYDPAKAGMPALFARLGRPILQAPPTSSRRERRRALRPERSAEGVGLAIAEARKRAGLDADAETAVEHPLVGGNPARAMRLALRAQAAVNAMGTPAAAPFVPPVEAPAPLPEAPAPVPLQARATEPAAPVDAPAAAAPKKRATRKAAQAKAAPEATARATRPATPLPEEPAPVVKARARKAAAPRTRARQAAPAAEETPSVAAAPEPAAVRPPVVPAPSPRRPRGPVPLAAWAHAVADEPKVEPRRADKRGFWRGIFRIPAEVALVEYAHGAKIHRLLIEAGDDHLPDFI